MERTEPFPRPIVPADNPMSAAKIELDRYLFYDKRMSVNGKEACASCHQQELAFTDGRDRAEGTAGELHPRSSMSLTNIGYSPLLTWANPSLSSLEEQAETPMFGTEPVELGLKGQEARLLSDIRSDQHTGKREDIGKFRAPTLRNIAVTAPYMHDGSIATLAEVIDHYAAGGRTISSGPYAGVGHDNPNKAPNVDGFKLTEAEKRDLLAFLESLTDTEFLHNARFSNPWKRQ